MAGYMVMGCTGVPTRGQHAAGRQWVRLRGARVRRGRLASAVEARALRRDTARQRRVAPRAQPSDAAGGEEAVRGLPAGACAERGLPAGACAVRGAQRGRGLAEPPRACARGRRGRQPQEPRGRERLRRVPV